MEPIHVPGQSASPTETSSKEKWARRLFAFGAFWLLLIGLVHSLSLIKNLVPANDTERQLIDLMTNYKFNLMGTMRSMDNLFRGFSIAFMLAALALGAIAFFLRRERTQLLKRVALLYLLLLVAMTAVSLVYFFPAPTFSLVGALLLFLSATISLPASSSAS